MGIQSSTILSLISMQERYGHQNDPTAQRLPGWGR